MVVRVGEWRGFFLKEWQSAAAAAAAPVLLLRALHPRKRAFFHLRERAQANRPQATLQILYHALIY
jgi:hypothetical protein